MNTRTLYHWLLWLSAACIACLGFLLIRAEGRSHALDAALMQASNQSAVRRSYTPQEIKRRAQSLLVAREKWDRKELDCWVTYNGYVWTVVCQGPDKFFAFMDFDKSGKLTEYHIYK